MGLTEEEAEFLRWARDTALTCPSPPLPKRKRQHSRQRSNSLGGLDTSSYRISSSFTGPPSPSASSTAGFISDPRPNLASSSWPQKGESPYSFPPLTLSSSALPKPEPNSVIAEEKGRLYLPPIKQPRRSSLSESLPPHDPIPRLPRPSLQPSSSASLSSATSTKRRGFPFRPPAANRDEFIPGSSNTHDGRALWTVIRDTGVPIYLGTPGFDVFSLCPSALGTYCSPTALLTAFSDTEVFYHAYAAGQRLSREDLVPSKNNTDGGVIQHAANVVLAEYGAALIDCNPGLHFTFINIRQDMNSNAIVRRARDLAQRFQEKGIAKDKVVVSIPATEEGVHATRLLSKEDGMLVNLAMVAGMSHAAACTEAGAAWITFHLDRLEKVYEDRGEHSQGVEAIQSTIALFDMHNVDTKIMISGFRDTRKIFEFPGAHGFSLTKEQIVAARLPTAQSCRIPSQSALSLPENAITLAKDAKWPPGFFDVTEAGGSNGIFIRYFSSRLQSILSSTQKDLFYHTHLATRDFMAMIRDDVVNYKIFMMQLLHPRTGLQILTREGVKGLKKRVDLRKDLRSGEKEWKGTVTGRLFPDVEWNIARVNRCEAWVTSDGRVEALIPEQWDRRNAASMNIYVHD